MRLLTLTLGLGWLLAAGVAAAADSCAVPADCSRQGTKVTCCTCCGGHACCRKVCKVVCTIQEVKKTVWTVECKEFCVPNPAICGGKCGTCGPTLCGEKCGVCSQTPCCCKPCQTPPKCGPVRTKKELIKKEIVCKVPTYKCVVVCCGRCPGDCGACTATKEPTPAAPNTPPPAGASPQPAPMPVAPNPIPPPTR
jgi:hypothetical protein